MFAIKEGKLINKANYSFVLNSFLMFFIVLLIYLGSKNYILFMGITNSIEIFIGISVSIIILNTYKMNRDNIFSILGVSFVFISMCNLLYIISYKEIGPFMGYNSDLYQVFCISKRYFEGVAMLLTFIFIGKEIKIRIITITYFIVLIFLGVLILNSYNTPPTYLEELFFNDYHIVLNGFLILLNTLGVFILYEKSKFIKKNLYILFSNILTLQIISNFIILVFIKDHYIFGSLYSIFRLVIYYLIYKAVIRTSLKEPYIRLKEGEERYKSLIELLPDGVLMGKENEILYANESFLKLLKYDDIKDVAGKNPKDLIHKEHCKKSKEEIIEGIINDSKNLGPSTKEGKLIKSDGDIIDVEVTTSVINRDNENYVIAIIKDIKDRIKALELSNKVKEEEELLNQVIENEKNRTMLFSSVSHELKTPLNIILGSTQLIEKNHEENTNCHYYNKLIRNTKIIKQNCYRLLRLINNLIDINKIENGFYNLEISNNNIISIVEDITLSVVPYCESKGIEIIFDTDLEERIIACDPIKIERIILNLLSNAIKFTVEKGLIWVTISNSEDGVIISIKDNGIGIPLDKQKHVFERFSQIHPNIDCNYGGSGIGLSLVKSLVEAHDGNIYINEEYTDGAEFIMVLKGKVLPDIENTREEVASSRDGLVERINIEFSDIYSIS